MQLPREPRASALLFTVCSVHRSVAVHPGDKSSDAYELPASSCTPLQFISSMLSLQTQGVNTAAPLSTCDRRIAQSSANEKRVQANTHRLPLFAVKSHWCKIGREKSETRWMWQASQTENSTSLIYTQDRALKVVCIAAVLRDAADRLMMKTYCGSTHKKSLTIPDINMPDN